MPQEFLASFAVDIDEGGANRLQSILAQNRELADGVLSLQSGSTPEQLLARAGIGTEQRGYIV